LREADFPGAIENDQLDQLILVEDTVLIAEPAARGLADSEQQPQ
jgi:hypothetical protein